MDLIENLLSDLGEFKPTNYPILECRIGDAVFESLISKLNYLQEHSFETEEQNSKKVVSDIMSCERLNAEQKEKEIELHERYVEILKFGLGMDYPSSLINQLNQYSGLISKGKYQNSPIRIADNHAHAYDFIVPILLSAEKPITIVRFDTHTDMMKSIEDKIDEGNYFSQIVLNNNLSSKIAKVVHINGLPEEKISNYDINGVPFISTGMFNLAEITEPIILDIDLDGCERGLRNEFNQGRAGGHIYKNKYHNQENMRLHPTVAAKILKNKITNPIAIGVALERGFRNRFFWYRVERDFLTELNN